ncbi:MAG: class I SAM-dependent methyltransferase, partial [Nitrospirae bacterium]
MESNGSPYYDQAELWREPAHYTDECVRIIESLAPSDVRSILDIGCGNGAITNPLTARFRTIGLDSSREALLHLQGARLLAESAAIPLRDQSVDLVLLSNVLEHLPAAVFSHTVKEAMRIARRYLLVVSPHDENLQFSQVKCDDCGCIYHRNYHLRSLTLADIDRVFGQGFEMSAYTFWGEPWPQYDRRLWELKQHLAEGWSRWPLAVCPLCGGKPGTK